MIMLRICFHLSFSLSVFPLSPFFSPNYFSDTKRLGFPIFHIKLLYSRAICPGISIWRFFLCLTLPWFASQGHLRIIILKMEKQE